MAVWLICCRGWDEGGVGDSTTWWSNSASRLNDIHVFGQGSVNVKVSNGAVRFSGERLKYQHIVNQSSIHLNSYAWSLCSPVAIPEMCLSQGLSTMGINRLLGFVTSFDSQWFVTYGHQEFIGLCYQHRPSVVC